MQRFQPAPPMAARLGRWLAALVLAGGAASSFGVLAQDRDRVGGAAAARTGLQWLQSIQQAAVRVNYSGTIVYQAGGEMRTSRITHLFDGVNSHERVQTLDGKPREFIRLRTENNDEVRCLIPESRRVVVEHRALEDPFPGMIGAPAEAILERYDLRTGEVERVAGVECQVLLLEPRDAMRYGYRLCVDRATGLLLKAQTVGEQREVLEQVAFTDVRIGDRIDRSRLKPSWPTEGWTVERSEYRRIDLDKAGWAVPTPEGFRLTKQVQRRIGPAEAIQVVFSDGLATLSVFIEPATAATGGADDMRTMGPTAVYSRRLADALVTVIGEVPPAAVRTVARSVEFRGPR
jgi:sigma-E factor negative regulatory protein RseB